jgi:D-alanyl-D-alanine carboxypeptidase (penicillin-binding protein 5/6)
VAASLIPFAVRAVAPQVPAPPLNSAKAHLLMDFASGEVLAEKNSHLRVEPASLTKIMTVYAAAAELAHGKVALDDRALISEKAWKMEGSRTFVEVGSSVPVRDLLLGVIVQSGNDASVALAEHLSGDESVFASLMNQHAERLGLTESHFANSTGLPDPQLYTTAADLAKLSAALIRDYPEVYALFAEREFVFNGIKQANRNGLLGLDESVDGIKTGHTEAAGYCLVSSAEREGMRLISVVLGAESPAARTEASSALLNYGFRFFESHALYKPGESAGAARVWKGAVEQVGIGPADATQITIPRGRYNDLKITVNVEQHLVAPIAAGDAVGELTVALDDKTLRAVPLVALQAVPEGSWLRRFMDSVALMFE